jgi:hypothetical protein
MKRNLSPFLLWLMLGFALALSGQQAAAARVSMAITEATTTEMVVCSQGSAETIRLDLAGNLVAPKPMHDCATCSECRLSAATAMPANPTLAPRVVSASLLATSSPTEFTPNRVATPVQARAPPKGL